MFRLFPLTFCTAWVRLFMGFDMELEMTYEPMMDTQSKLEKTRVTDPIMGINSLAMISPGTLHATVSRGLSPANSRHSPILT